MSESKAKRPPSHAAGAFAGVKRARLFPKPLGDAVGFAAAINLRKRGFGDRNLLRDWPAIVGHELARHTAPLKLSKPSQGSEPQLYIQARGGFALHVQHMEPVILERLTIYYGYPVARRVVIIQ